MLLFDDDRLTGSSEGDENMEIDDANATLSSNGWSIIHVLGEGTHGQVLLATDTDGQAVAVKCIDIVRAPEAERRTAVKEAQFLNVLRNNENIVKLLGDPIESTSYFYIFMEFANGGELFDQIDPDVGMRSVLAQHYFVQLLHALNFMHAKGIAHRDIKPENLLLVKDECIVAASGVRGDRLLVSDFGYATLFEHHGKRRMSSTQCGTVPYMAPEIFNAHNVPYDASPTDVWSSGVVLVAVLTGLMPFFEATPKCHLYARWLRRTDRCHLAPWRHVGNMALALLCEMLEPEPGKRCTVAEALRSKWVTADLNAQPAGATRVRSRDCSPIGGSQPAHQVSMSDCLLLRAADRPLAALTRRRAALQRVDSDDDFDINDNVDVDVDSGLTNVDKFRTRFHTLGGAFSQPIEGGAALLPSQTQKATQSQSQNDWLLRTYRRMTRFTLGSALPRCMALLAGAARRLSATCRVAQQADASALLVWTASDQNGNQVTMHVRCISMNAQPTAGPAHTLVEFHRTKGDGLESKRMFVRVRAQLDSYICKHPIGADCTMGHV